METDSSLDERLRVGQAGTAAVAEHKKPQKRIYTVGSSYLIVGCILVLAHVLVREYVPDVRYKIITYTVILLAFSAFQISNKREVETLENQLISTLSDLAPVKTLIRSLRNRASLLRLVSRAILVLTFITIAAGLYLFTAAGSISSRDNLTLSRAMDEVDRYTERLDRGIRNTPVSELSYYRLSRADLQAIRDDVLKSSSAVVQSVNKLEQASSSNDRLYFFLSTIATRIGSVLLLVFLVQILISVYRYSVRLESYYDARADALLIFNGNDADQLQQLVLSLSPEIIQFGKTPSSPAEHAVDLAKEIVALRK